MASPQRMVRWPRARSVAARIFSGIDLSTLCSLSAPLHQDPGHVRELFCGQILLLKSVFSALKRYRKPVVAKIVGIDVVDLFASCDVWYCTARATFVVKEVNLLAAGWVEGCCRQHRRYRREEQRRRLAGRERSLGAGGVKSKKKFLSNLGHLIIRTI